MSTDKKTTIRVTVEAVVESLHWFADTADATTAGDINSFWRHADATTRLEAALAEFARVATIHPTIRPLAARVEVFRRAVNQIAPKPGRYPPASDEAEPQTLLPETERHQLLQQSGQQQHSAKLAAYRKACEEAERNDQPPPLIGGCEQIMRRFDRLPEQARRLADDLSAAVARLPNASRDGGKRGRIAVDPVGTKKTANDWRAFHKGTPGATYADFISARRLDMTVSELKRVLARDRKAMGKTKTACGAPNPSSEI